MKFKVEAAHNDTRFKVRIKKWWWFWQCGFWNTNYFSCSYYSEEEALTAIRKYKARFTKVE